MDNHLLPSYLRSNSDEVQERTRIGEVVGTPSKRERSLYSPHLPTTITHLFPSFTSPFYPSTFSPCSLQPRCSPPTLLVSSSSLQDQFQPLLSPSPPPATSTSSSSETTLLPLQFSLLRRRLISQPLPRSLRESLLFLAPLVLDLVSFDLDFSDASPSRSLSSHPSAAYCSAESINSGAALSSIVAIDAAGNDQTIPGWFVAYDASLGAIIVAHQGTNPTSILSLMEDAEFIPTDLDESMFPGEP